MRTAVRWVGKRVTSWLIGQLLLWLLTVWVGWLLTQLIEDIKVALARFNDKMLEQVFVVEDFLFHLQSSVYGGFDSLLSALESSITGALNSFTPEGNDALKGILGWADWVDQFFMDIGAAVGSVVGTFLSPVILVLQSIRGQSIDIQTAILSLFDTYNNNILAIKAIVESGGTVDWDSFMMTADDLGMSDLIADILGAEHSLEGVQAQVEAEFAAAVSPEFKARLEAFMEAAWVEAIRYKRDQVEAYFTDIRSDLNQSLDESQQAVITKTTEMRDAVHAAEVEVVEMLPALLKPTLMKSIDRIKEQILENEEEIMVNIDQFLIDTTTVDRLLSRIPKRPSGEAPIRFDSAAWSLDDIYRMLCNYYWRHERMALAVLIAAVDMEIDTNTLLGLMADAAPHDNTEEVEQDYEETQDEVEEDLWGPMM